jgi:D-glycero-D-manno-heptose 1,7-bisphosphate phosphatase
VVEAIHAHLREALRIDDIKVCYHTDSDSCDCRKPKPGMLLDAAEQWGIDLASSIMVGDRWRDVDAGKAAGCRTILIENAYDERRAEGFDATAPSLLEASRLILRGQPFNTSTVRST